MITKVDDRNVTAEMVDAMAPQELKAFENRLRSIAFKQNLKLGKFVHPFIGPMFALSRCAKAVLREVRGDLGWKRS